MHAGYFQYRVTPKMHVVGVYKSQDMRSCDGIVRVRQSKFDILYQNETRPRFEQNCICKRIIVIDSHSHAAS